MPFLLAEILNFQCALHLKGVGSLSQIRENHFTKGLDYLHLSEQGSKIILSEYDKRLKQTIMHKELGREVSYRYLIRLECYKLIKHLYDEKKYDSFVMWW